MADYQIRRVTGMEYYTTARKIADYAFSPSPTEPLDPAKQEEQLQYVTDFRTFVAFQGDQPLATVNLIPFTQNVRGKVFPMSGVSGVATLPEARRKGLVRATFDEAFRSMQEAGEPLTTLYPFRESFYERLGYANMSQTKVVRFSPAALAPSTRRELRGSAEQHLMADGWQEWRAYLERYQARRHGFALSGLTWARRGQTERNWWLLLARDPAGTVVGGATFKITGYTETLEVSRFYYDDPDARMLLLEWLARHVDHVNEVKITVAVDDYPDLWVNDLYSRVVNDDKWFTTPMGRVVDVAGLGGMETGPGAIALEITDPQVEANTGIWTFATGADGRLTVERGGTAEASLTIQGLSALVFIGHDPAEFRLRGWGDPDARAQATLRAMFPFRSIQIHESF